MLTRGEYSEPEILYFEGLILRKISWNLMFTTPADFVSLFLNQGIVYSDDLVFADKFGSQPKPPTLKNIRYVRKYCEFFVDLCLQEQAFHEYSSIILAISIILAARKSVNISPIWNDEFSKLFMMNFKHVEKCYIEIYSFYEASFPNQTHTIIKPAKVIPSVHKTKPKKENRSVRTRYTSSETSNRNRSSTKSSIRSKKDIHSWNIRDKNKEKRSNNNSVISHKAETNREDNKISLRRATQIGMSGSSNKKKLKIRYKNKDIADKMTLKLDFNSKSITTFKRKNKLSNKIPKAPQTKRNSESSGTFYKANYEKRQKLSSRNNLAAYSGIYSTLDTAKHHISQHEARRENLLSKGKDSSSCQKISSQFGIGFKGKETTSALRKIGHNWGINNIPGWKLDKNKNYSSMTSLMNRPAGVRKFSFQNNKNAFALNDSASFAIKNDAPETDKAQLAKRSKLHKNIFQQMGLLSRRNSSTVRPKNPSLGRKYV